MTQDLDRYKGYLRQEVETSTQRSKSGLYNCPICGSGTGANHTGALGIYDDGKRWKCQSCGRGGDIFDFIAARDNTSLSDATKTVISRYGESGIASASSNEQRAKKEKSSIKTQSAWLEPPISKKNTSSERISEEEGRIMQDFGSNIATFAAALEGSVGESYLQGRGLTRETMQRFHLGYDAQHHTITIPYNQEGTYYGQRSISDNARIKHSNLPGARMMLFNPGALYNTDTCYIVESPLCAISIAQCGGNAVAISGTSGGGRLMEQLKAKPTNAALIMCLDNDEPGRKAADELAVELEEAGYFARQGTEMLLCEDEEEAPTCKDPNEFLQKYGNDALVEAVARTSVQIANAHKIELEAEEAARQARTGAGMVNTFLEVIQTRRYEPIPTGIRDIDYALEGGLMRQQLVLLGAPPAAGKTALAQWLFEGMAARGITSVYLNLEMSREQMLARSIARLSAAKTGTKISATRVLQGYKWTDEERAAILRAANEYKQTIAPYMVYNPDGIAANLDSIITYIETEAQRAEKTGQAAPLVILDYLQLIGGQPREDGTEVIKRAVAALKGYAIKHNTIAFVIMAHNREANKKGETTMESGRDTSALEYSADLQFGLDFTRCKKRDGHVRKTAIDLTAEDKHFITLKINKARFSQVGREVDLYFNGETMTFTQTANEFESITEKDQLKPIKKRF